MTSSNRRAELAAQRAETERLCEQYSQSRDVELRNQLVEAHQWLVLLTARQLQRRREPLDDLVQVANIGLIDALDRFDPSFGVTFRTFASATLKGVLRHHYRTTWRFKLPRRVQELHLSVSRSAELLSAELQRSPTITEVARLAHASEEDVIEAIEAGANFWPLSLSHATDVETEHDLVIIEDIGEGVERRVDVLQLLASLPDRERLILHLRYFEDLTQTEIGDRLGLSQVHVSRIMRAAVRQLRATTPGLDGDYA